MNVIVGATPYAQWQPLQPLLEHLGLRPPARVLLERWESQIEEASPQTEYTANAELLVASRPAALIDMADHPERLGQWLQTDHDLQVLMFHGRPEAALVRALEAHEAPRAALRNWLTIVEMVLGVYRRTRHRCMLVSIESALESPNLFLKSLEARLGIEKGPWSQPLSRPTESGKDLLRVIAAQQVAQDAAAQAALNELEASSLPIGEPTSPPVIDCDTLWKQIELQDRAHSADEQEHRVEGAEASSAATPRTPKSTQSLALGEAAQSELEETKAENEFLLKQLHEVQEELERCYLENRTRLSDVSQSKDYKRVLAERDALLSSLSWRVTVPLRWLLRPFAGPPTKKSG